MTTAPTLLLAEPDILIRTPLATYLRDCGYTVREVANGKEAIAVLQEMPVDVVLSAIDLDGEFNGFVLSQWVRTHLPQVNVLLAGSVDRAVESAAKLCDTGPPLSRPYDHATVADHIKRLLSSRNRY